MHNALTNGFISNYQDEIIETQALVIEKVDISTAEGGEVKTGEDAYLTLYYQSAKDLGEVTWGFSFWSADQRTRIATCTAKHSGMDCTLLRGKGRLRCKLPSLPLVAGGYVVKVGIYDIKTSWPIARKGWEDMPAYFEVKPSGSEIDNRRMIDGDIVAIDVEWMA